MFAFKMVKAVLFYGRGFIRIILTCRRLLFHEAHTSCEHHGITTDAVTARLLLPLSELLHPRCTQQGIIVQHPGLRMEE